MTACVFCDRARISSPVEMCVAAVGGAIYDVMVFEPLDPVVPGHLLVVPVMHVDDATVNPQVSAAAMKVASKVASRYDAANIITSIGRAATQSVFHLHVHVVPRASGDGLPLPWSRRRIERDRHGRFPRSGS